MKLIHSPLLLLLLVCPVLEAAINVSIDRNPVHVNESFQLTFDADESPDEDPDFSPLQQYFAILNSSQNSSISIINGDYKRSIKWTLQLVPKQVGDIVVPSIHFGGDKTSPFPISVKPAAQPAAGSSSGLIFELSADRESVAVQGQTIITMRLMSDTNISAYEFGDLVVDNIDVVTEPLGDVNRFQTRLGDKPYLVLEQKFALFPQNSGTMFIKPVLGQVRLSTSSRSVFDPFQTRGEIRSVYSPELKLEVTGINQTFSGQHWLPSSNLRLSEVWQEDFDSLVAGEPITRTIMLVAEGLTAAQLPIVEQAEVNGIKQYPDQAVLNNQRSEHGIVGVQQQKTALIPTAGGEYRLPEISLAWWNTDTQRQQVATIPARVIRVAAAQTSATTTPQVPSSQVSTNETTVAPLDVVQQTNRFWVWLSLFLASGWLLSALFWWWNRGDKDQQSSESLSRSVNLHQASKQLKQACENNNASEVREALIEWARALDIDACFHHLNDLAGYFGEPLKSQISRMNQSLYGNNSDAWQGADIWQTCQSLADDISPKETVSRESLVALNP